MANNIEQFSIFAAAILDRLYDHFPLVMDISGSQFVDRPDLARMFAELDKTLQAMPNDGSFAKANVASREGQKITAAFHEGETRAKIFRGTLEFLIAEQFVRCSDASEGLFSRCQLTAKGFAHLHAEFKDKAIVGESSAIIKWIKNRFASSSAVEGALFVSLISKFLLGA